ncbi:hypothetical protein G7Z17_g2425 [Cylindrodendrum hubeiense]|uniref:WSC domain-containing protein n=1 Tax=Cylindrodendrum hubeiense TaxID=595255 RepID=A0A9P5LKB9_9HYPO|nr:hypothetical protein G7Z17_g2425 [Cylindrodendrum hubeiense]
MAGIFFVGILSVLATAAASGARPKPPDGWVRVGCVQLNRQDFPVEYQLVDQDDCISRCGSSKTGSHFAAIGDACRCASKSLDGITVTTTDEDRCKAFCYSEDPEAGTCGALIGGIQYYDLYKESSDDITVTKKPGYPPPLGTVTTSAETKATDSQLTTTGSCQDDGCSASATSTTPSAATAGSDTAQPSESCSGSDCAENASSSSYQNAFGAVLAATFFIIASFLT